jgi:hypothetical protein
MSQARGNEARWCGVPLPTVFTREDRAMRVFLGIILGVFLTIASVFIVDTLTTGPTATAQTSVERRPMVNWDVVGKNWHVFTERVRYGWNRLSTG